MLEIILFIVAFILSAIYIVKKHPVKPYQVEFRPYHSRDLTQFESFFVDISTRFSPKKEAQLIARKHQLETPYVIFKVSKIREV